MAALLFRLNNVPQDEAEAIRNLLEEAKLDYYETSAGHWGLSFAAIWLKDEKQLVSAQQLVEHFQSDRLVHAQQQIEQQKKSGEYNSRWAHFKSSPFKTILVVSFSALLLYFSVIPFFN